MLISVGTEIKFDKLRIDSWHTQKPLGKSALSDKAYTSSDKVYSQNIYSKHHIYWLKARLSISSRIKHEHLLTQLLLNIVLS